MMSDDDDDDERNSCIQEKDYIVVVKYETYPNIPPCLRHIYDSAGV